MQPGPQGLLAASELVRDAPLVILTGMGASLFACMPLQYYLAARGRRVVLIETAELLHYQPEICPGAAVVVVSRSGDTSKSTSCSIVLAGVMTSE